jgi:hypothetical protein
MKVDKKCFLALLFLLLLIIIPPNVHSEMNWENRLQNGDYLIYNYTYSNQTITTFYELTLDPNNFTIHNLINETESTDSHTYTVNILITNITNNELFANFTVLNGTNIIQDVPNNLVGVKIPSAENFSQYALIHTWMRNDLFPDYNTLYMLNYDLINLNDFYVFTAFSSSFSLTINQLDTLQNNYPINNEPYGLRNVYRARYSGSTGIFSRQFGTNPSYDDFNWNCLTGVLMERERYEYSESSISYQKSSGIYKRIDQIESLMNLKLDKTSITIPMAIPNIIWILLATAGLGTLIIVFAYKKLYNPRKKHEKEIENILSKKSTKSGEDFPKWSAEE